MNNEQLKRLHKEKNTKAINENLYKANIKLVDMNRYLKIDIENLHKIIDKAIYYIELELYNVALDILKGEDNE